MFIFDTNVLSEVTKEAPDPAVVARLTACPAEMMFTRIAGMDSAANEVRLIRLAFVAVLYTGESR